MINKTKWAFGASIAIIGALAVASIVMADATSTPSIALGSSCSGNVSANVVTWNAVATGGTAPYTFAWSGDSLINGATSTQVIANYLANGNYTATITVHDSASSTAIGSCTVTVSSFTTPTSTPPVVTTSTAHTTPKVSPSLSIGPNGAFMGQGMTVTSIGTNSFQATVWGLTYNVNWNGSLNTFAFYYRVNKATTTEPMAQLAVGDIVGVSGKVSTSTPTTVTATAVRDYSIVGARNPGKEVPAKTVKNFWQGISDFFKGNGKSGK